MGKIYKIRTKGGRNGQKVIFKRMRYHKNPTPQKKNHFFKQNKKKRELLQAKEKKEKFLKAKRSRRMKQRNLVKYVNGNEFTHEQILNMTGEIQVLAMLKYNDVTRYEVEQKIDSL